MGIRPDVSISVSRYETTGRISPNGEGIRLSKGASRERGLEDLLGMVRRPPPDDEVKMSPDTDLPVDEHER